MNLKVVTATASAAVLATLCLVRPAYAEDASDAPMHPPFKLSVAETVDFLHNTTGGVSVGSGVDNLVAVAATLDGENAGLPGFRAHVEIFNSTEGTFSAERSGDIQIVSNIEAPRSTRLFAAWAEKTFGTAVIRAGLMDVNVDFDSIEPAGLFLNSSHGIGMDISQTGPSIYPVSALGVRGIWSPSESFTVRAAVFDGVAGDPNFPHDFVRVRLKGEDGALVIGEADLKLGKDYQLSVGGWGYTASFDAIDPLLSPQQGQAGVYASIQGPVPLGPGWSGWLRYGIADSHVNVVGSYFGAGLVKKGPIPLPGRGEDKVGIAIARASIGGPARRIMDLPTAETSLEATYSFQAASFLTLQPDVQYIIHPASAPNLKNAFVVGLRVALSLSTPAGTSDDED